MFKNWMKTTIVLYILWIIFSGRMEIKFLITGFVSAAVIALVCLPAMWIPEKGCSSDGHNGGKKFFLLDLNIGRYMAYWIWLIWQIIKSCISVAITVCRPKMKIQPQFIEFDCPYSNPMATTLLINSIILTPGTLTVDVANEEHFIVHALTDSATLVLIDGEMQRRIAAVFRDI